MSFAALAWASKYRAESAAMKLVLLAYADRHNEETGHAYPSIAWLAEFSSLNRKTVIAAVEKLEKAGLLTDTGERRGDTKQIKVYSVNVETVPKTEQFPKRNSTGNGAKQSQKRDTDTIRTSTLQKATPSSSKRAGPTPRFRMPEDWKPVRFADGTVARAVVDRRGREWAISALESFRNWAANADDRVGRKIDWQKAWANWVIEQDTRHGNGKSNSQPGIRGRRPDPAVDLRNYAEALAAEEAASGDCEADSGLGVPLPAYLTG